MTKPTLSALGMSAGNHDPSCRPPSNPRVAIITHYMPPHIGGIENVAQDLFGIYRAARFEVRWIASHVPKDRSQSENGLIRVECWNGLERWLGLPWPIWGPAGVCELARLVHWADIIHVHDCLYLGSALAMLLARRARKPVILSQHIGFVRYTSMILNGCEQIAYHTLGRVVLRGVSQIVFCTAEAEQFVTKLLGRRPTAATTIFNGIDTERFRPPTPAERATARQTLGVPELGRVVLFAGRLVEKKGVSLFVDVARQMPSYHFLMVGEGSLHPVTTDNLTWIPSVPMEHMEMAYQAADVLLLPSHSEGFPLAILEAMATGLPVITSRGQTFANLLESEGACLVVDRSSAGFRAALNHLLESPELAASIAARSREFVLRDHSLEAVGERYIRIIRDLAALGQTTQRRSDNQL